MTLSDYLMRLATRYAPKGRREWAQAMQAEFDVLTRGKLSWAFGCLVTATGWRLRSEALYLLAMIAAVTLVPYVLIPVLFQFPPHFPPHTLIGRYVFYLWASLPLICVCACMGAWKPNRIIQTGILITLIDIVQTYIFFFLVFHTPFNRYVHIMDRPPVIGETVLLTGCLISTAMGGLIGKSWRRFQPTSRA